MSSGYLLNICVSIVDAKINNKEDKIEEQKINIQLINLPRFIYLTLITNSQFCSKKCIFKTLENANIFREKLIEN